MVYITGDTHGDYSRFSQRDARRLRKGDTLIVLGDFGFLWDGSKQEQQRLKKLSKKKYTLLFLDGPHENYDMFKEYPISEWNGGRVQRISDNVMHLLRGEIFQIEGDSYFVFGGGECPDSDLRADSSTTWEEAMPSGEDMLRGRSNLEAQGNKVNFILTHEPSGKAKGYTGLTPVSKSPAASRLSGVNAYLNLIEDTVQYDCWYFGSLHLDKALSKRHLAVFRRILPVHDHHKGKHAK